MGRPDRRARLVGGPYAWIRSIAFDADGERIAVGANTGFLALFDARTGERLQELRGHRGPVVGLSFSPDGALLASNSSQDHSLRVWRLDIGLTLGRPAWTGVDGVVSLGWSDGGRKIVTSHLLAGGMVFDLDGARMRAAACSLARRNLSTVEWREYFGDQPYRRSCRRCPTGAGRRARDAEQLMSR